MRARIPRYQHLPLQILWFDLEDIGLILTMYFFWLMIDHWICLVLMIVVPWAFKNAKTKMPRGFLKHLVYRIGFWKSKFYPPTAVTVHHE